MERLELDRDARTASFRGDVVALLPKEFQLLEFLYRNNGRTFRRDELLDAVWPLEAPTDRTVDDHVYRLRKKLSRWREAFDIETVRGAGYRMVRREAPDARTAHPLLGDPEHAERMRALLDAQLQYGRGDALLALAKQPELFGFAIEGWFRLYVMFMEGRYRELVADPAPFEEKAFFLLHLFHAAKPEASRPYVEEAIRRNGLPAVLQFELERITLASMLMDWGEPEAADRKLEEALQSAEAENDTDILPFLWNMRLEFQLLQGRWQEAARYAAALERRYERHPFQREEGRFYVMKGLLRFRDEPGPSIGWIDRGLATLRASRFRPHYGSALDLLIGIAARERWPRLVARYGPDRERYRADTGLDELTRPIEEELRRRLL